jgi:NUDIX domain
MVVKPIVAQTGHLGLLPAESALVIGVLCWAAFRMHRVGISVVAVTGAMGGEAGRWRTFGEREIYRSPYTWLGQVDVELPGGERFWHEVIRLHRAAAMLLVDDADRVLLLWRHRFVLDRWGWELPGGLVDEDEEPAEAAVRELEEETGYRAGAGGAADRVSAAGGGDRR